MAEYIEREKLLNAMEEMCKRVCDYSPAQRHFMCGSCPLGSAFELVEEFAAVDVQPVKRGRWIDKNPQDKYDPRCICSVCGSVEFPLSRHKYCPNCGAEMDGET